MKALIATALVVATIAQAQAQAVCAPQVVATPQGLVTVVVCR
jgi:hypothetical protein